MAALQKLTIPTGGNTFIVLYGSSVLAHFEETRINVEKQDGGLGGRVCVTVFQLRAPPPVLFTFRFIMGFQICLRGVRVGRGLRPGGGVANWTKRHVRSGSVS